MNNVEKLTSQVKVKMDKAVEHMKLDFSAVRTGKASPALVEGLAIEYYGTTLKLKEMASITAPEPRMLIVQPYDIGASQTIEKTIRASNLNINPINDGKIIRLPIPELSEERRHSLAKQVSTKAEETRVHIRNARREGNELSKKAEKAGEITEDELSLALKKIQDLTDKTIADVDAVLGSKEKELMHI